MVMLMDRHPGACCWPIGGEGAATLYCAAPTAGSARQGYCPDHADRMVRCQGRPLNEDAYALAGNVILTRPAAGAPLALDSLIGADVA